ncbi:hypothetical protein NDU88_002681 [Pleurodeles waltl]|uniref:Uncharacterized protein n=1 Tax=Pleurodeles waltl TaxID=8319 RepID=A0AAV7MTH2_PLEWA|nr:hypothetical protein NDU88_002681 [Pleurodeles waltl]
MADELVWRALQMLQEAGRSPGECPGTYLPDKEGSEWCGGGRMGQLTSTAGQERSTPGKGGHAREGPRGEHGEGDERSVKARRLATPRGGHSEEDSAGQCGASQS